MSIETEINRVLSIRHPLLLAPMAHVAGGRLAAAVSRAGGLGFIGGGYGDPLWLQQQLALAGDARVGIGFITWRLREDPELLKVALAAKPCAVLLSFGALEPFAERIKSSGALLIAQIQSVAHARAAQAAGADVIVAQGTEAGGHGGQRSTFPLVPAVVDAVAPMPVLAAGGISDGRGLAAALMLGASGVVMGTGFYASEESLAMEAAKAVAINASGDDTVRSRVFDILRRRAWPSAYALRTVKNAMVSRWLGREDELSAKLDEHVGAFNLAIENQDTEIAPVIVGEGVDLLHRTEPAAEIVERIINEAATALKSAKNFQR